MIEQLDSWFGDRGLPILALGGYASQSYAKEITDAVMSDGRPAILLYAGDYDPTGDDIFRDLQERTNIWDGTHRIALTQEQVEQYNLPKNPAKEKDSRNKSFEERHGEVVQVEMDALDPNDLHDLFLRTLDDHYWNPDAFDQVLEREEAEREVLARLNMLDIERLTSWPELHPI